MKSRDLLLTVLLFFSAFMLFISGWSFPRLDDYLLFYLKRNWGFWGMQAWIYHHNSGRYLSSFIGACFSYDHFLTGHYYLHSIFLILFTIAAMYWTISKMMGLVLHYPLSPKINLLYALLFFLVSLAVTPEIFTAYYWFSSAVTYQTGNILCVLLAGFAAESIFGPGKKRRLFFTAITACTIMLINGTNELVALLLPGLFLSAIIPMVKWGFVSKKKAILLTLVFVVSLFFLFLAPGISHRAHEFSDHSLIWSLGTGLFWLASSWWYLFKVPLCWLFLGDVFFGGMLIGRNDQEIPFLVNLKQISLKRGIMMVAGWEFIALFPLVYAVQGSLATRALNVMVFMNLLILTVFALWFGLSRSWVTDHPAMKTFSRYRYLFYIVLLFSGSLFFQCLQTAISGYFYQKIKSREMATLESAHPLGQTFVRLNNYKTAVKMELQHRYGGKVGVRVRKLLLIKPSLLNFNFSDKAERPNDYELDYYQLDSLTIGREGIKNHLQKSDYR